MNRINQKGLELLQYKGELLKDYPKIVKDSLHLSLSQLVENNLLDSDTLFLLQDQTQSVDSFESYLYEKPAYLKTDEEIFEEYEAVRKDLVLILEENGLGEMTTESLVQKDCILTNKKFAIDEAFTMEFFGVKEADLIKLMKRRGFIEKFAVLRLTAIFEQFVQEMKSDKPKVKGDLSLVYYDKETNSYAIDLFFEIPIELTEDKVELADRCLEIRGIVERAETLFEEKTRA